jgi:hypothetical protein
MYLSGVPQVSGIPGFPNGPTKSALSIGTKRAVYRTTFHRFWTFRNFHFALPGKLPNCRGTGKPKEHIGTKATAPEDVIKKVRLKHCPFRGRARREE